MDKLLQRMSIYMRPSDNGCIEWSGAKDKDGYPLIHYKRLTRRAQRLLWETMYSEVIAPNKVIRHKCDNPSCMAPSHMELGTQKDNREDSIDRGRWAHPVVTSDMSYEIRKLYTEGKSKRYIAKVINVHLATVYHHLRG